MFKVETVHANCEFIITDDNGFSYIEDSSVFNPMGKSILDILDSSNNKLYYINSGKSDAYNSNILFFLYYVQPETSTKRSFYNTNYTDVFMSDVFMEGIFKKSR